MNEQVVLEQDEAVSTLASEPSIISAGNDITITTIHGDIVIGFNHTGFIINY
jgi:hypothetical protein